MIASKTKTLILAAVVLSGCKSAPGKVCDKIDELAVKAMSDGDEVSKKMASGMQAESSTCLSRMQAMEQKDPQEFARATACIENTVEIHGVVQCFFKAAIGDRAPETKGSEPAKP